MIDFNNPEGVIVDDMGLPLSVSDAKLWLETLKAHIRKHPAQLAEVAERIAKKRYPNMVEQMNLKPSRFE